MKKEKQPSLDVIRAVSAIAIVLFHYSYIFYEYSIPGHGPDFLNFASGDWGAVFVADFFMLSGAALIYNYGDIRFKDLPGFYKKRWLSIFPMFYTAWAIMYVLNSRKMGGWFWGGPRRNFLLTFFGMDGYLMHHGKNYYCLGEWFLGAIIILYLLFPFLAMAFRKFRIPATLLVLFLFTFNLHRHAFSSAPDVNILIRLIKYYNSHITISDNMCVWTCVFDFWLGMLLITYRDKVMKPALLLCLAVISLPFIFQVLPVNKLWPCAILATAVYIFLTLVTPQLMNCAPAAKMIRTISKYSYGIFLVHHVMLYDVMLHFRNVTFNRLTSTLFFIPVFLLILAVGILLTEGVNAVLRLIGRLFSSIFSTTTTSSTSSGVK